MGATGEITTWIAVATAFFATAFLSRELARKKERDAYFYFFVGLFLGPFAIMMVLTPLPERYRAAMNRGAKQLRVVPSKDCPRCRHRVGVKAEECPYCGADIEARWWEKDESIPQH